MRLPLTLGPAALLAILPLFFLDLEGLRKQMPDELYVFGHTGFFGLLAGVLVYTPGLRQLPYRQRALLVLVLILVGGILIEVIQSRVGRSGNAADVWQNMVGAGAAIALLAPGTWRQRTVLIAGAVGVLFVELFTPTITMIDRGIARYQFPVLAEFSTPLEHQRWSSGRPDETLARSGGRSLKVRLSADRRYTGTTLRRSLGDWSGFDNLELSIHLEDEPPLLITISIRDYEHFSRGGEYHDRFNRSYTLREGWNDIVIPIEAIRDAPRDRRMDLSDLTELAIFTSRPERQRIIHLDRVVLTRQ